MLYKFSKKNIIVYISLIFVILFAISGCSISNRRDSVLSEGAIRTAKTQSYNLEAPSMLLSAFSNFTLEPIELSDEVAERSEKVEIAKQLENKLRARLLPLIDEVSTRTSGTLEIHVIVNSVRINSARAKSAARFAGGNIAFLTAAGSIIVLNLELVENETSTIIANPNITKVTGMSRSGATDRNLLDYITEVIYQYLAENYKK